jgi:hypothetical protein
VVPDARSVAGYFDGLMAELTCIVDVRLIVGFRANDGRSKGLNWVYSRSDSDPLSSFSPASLSGPLLQTRHPPSFS